MTFDNSIDENHLTIDELMRDRANRLPDKVIFAYPKHDMDYEEFTFKELDTFAYIAARQYNEILPVREKTEHPNVTVALLGPSNLDYLISILALTKLDHSILYLSTRISEAAYLSLLKNNNVKMIFFHPSFEPMVNKLKKSMPNMRATEIVSQTYFRDSERILEASKVSDTRLDHHIDHTIENSRVCWIIHSSGSTGVPKSIPQTQRASLQNYTNNMNMRGFITLPLFHSHGIASFFRGVSCCKELYMYSANLPLTSPNIIKIMSEHQFEVFYGVPYALKLLCETEEGINILQKLKMVTFGGSSCPDELGDILVRRGVNLVSHYGSTETGQLMMSLRDSKTDFDWNYLRVPKKLEPHILFEKVGSSGLYEVVIKEGWPSKVASNRPDGSYATKDTFTPHPTRPGLWKYFARIDDTIVLVNGEKANPIPMEHAIRRHSFVKEVMVVGAGKPQLAMLVVASEATEGLSSSDIINTIWPEVERANTQQDDFARISKDMIHVLPPTTEYPRTDKGTIIRAAFSRQLSSEIEELYKSTDESAGENGLSLTEEELKPYLHELIVRTLGIEDPDILMYDTDFFSFGMDSLQSTNVRTQIIKSINTGSGKVGFNIVFENPNINQLAHKLFTMRSAGAEGDVSVYDSMKATLEKYSRFEPHQPVDSSLSGEYILVTGATGSLGAHILSVLVRLPAVKKVYALVRAASTADAEVRVVSSLIERKIYHSMSLTDRQKIVSIPSDLSKPDLGLSPAMHEDILKCITKVIHPAWSVNFNMSFQSFEDNIKGAHNLIQLCLDSRRSIPAAFFFVSSVSAVTFSPNSYAREEIDSDFTHAQNMGYARSKIVTENLCSLASRNYGAIARVLRVGQICGDTVYGVWNATEAISLIFQSAVTIGAVPELNENCRWLPVDIVAHTVVDLTLLSDEDKDVRRDQVFNVVNPTTFHWSRDLIPMMKEANLTFDVLPQQEWIQRLRTSNTHPVLNPPFKLLEFFASKYDKETPREPSGMNYETENTVKKSLSLANRPMISADLIKRFINYWLENSWNKTAKKSANIILIGTGIHKESSDLGQNIALILGNGIPSVSAENSFDNAIAHINSIVKSSSTAVLYDVPVAKSQRKLYRDSVSQFGGKLAILICESPTLSIADPPDLYEDDIIPLDVSSDLHSLANAVVKVLKKSVFV
ncbi:male sterility protein [Dipodascopsis uninucleata]